MAKCIDLTGKKFGRLTVIKRVTNENNGKLRWLCMCECGNEKQIRGGRLTSGATKSCGCLMREVIRKNMTTHGMTDTRIHAIWSSMKRRCNNPLNNDYNRYGGRGITIDSDWNDNFERFYEWAISHGYTDSLTIDRKSNDGNYTPSNCRWVTRETQASNRSNTLYVFVDGSNIPLTTHLRKIGRFSDYSAIYHYMKHRGLTLEESLIRDAEKKAV